MMDKRRRGLKIHLQYERCLKVLTLGNEKKSSKEVIQEQKNTPSSSTDPSTVYCSSIRNGFN